MEMQNEAVLGKRVPLSGEKCHRCHRERGSLGYGKRLCNSCGTQRSIINKARSKKGLPPLTVEQYLEYFPFGRPRGKGVLLPSEGQVNQKETTVETDIQETFAIADPLKPAQEVAGNEGSEVDTQIEESLSSINLARTISWVKCKTCAKKTVLSQDRNLCFQCNRLFFDFEQKEGGETTMERFVEWYRNRHRSAPAMVQFDAPSTSHAFSSTELIPGLLIGSEEMAYVAKMIRRVAATNASVCIFGETGTGKELVAKAIHELSPRKKKPFAIVDCTGLSEKIAESELFGHARGAFTGAQYQVEGLIAAAHTGSVFFDEISVLESSLQPKLLRVLQERHFRPVGKTAYQEVDMRVIVATNQSLSELVKQRKFREDLYHRLNVFPITIPPLRERKKEILILARYFLLQWGVTSVWLSQKVEEIFQQYSWSGNVRELRNVLERALIMRGEEKRFIEPEDLPQEMQ